MGNGGPTKRNQNQKVMVEYKSHTKSVTNVGGKNEQSRQSGNNVTEQNQIKVKSAQATQRKVVGTNRWCLNTGNVNAAGSRQAAGGGMPPRLPNVVAGNNGRQVNRRPETSRTAR